ncbi:MAG: hypothetical protein V3S81_10850, partial [Anaerolineales bacterium]
MIEPVFHFGTAGSPQSTPKRPGGSIDTLLHLSSLGLTALELGWVSPETWSPCVRRQWARGL